VVAYLLHCVANSRADQSTFERLLVIDRRAGNGSNDRSAGLAVMVAMAPVMFRRGKCTFSRREQRERKDGCLNFRRGLAGHDGPPTRENCEIDAATPEM
jgi:hypothetical protein